MGAGLLDLSTAGVDTSYPPLAVAVAIMGAGMGLVMAPASTTIMTTVPGHQAGAGSAIDEHRSARSAAPWASRSSAAWPRTCTAGGLRQHAGRRARAAAGEPPGHQLGRRSRRGRRRLGGVTGGQLAAAAHSAFTTAMGTGMRVAAVVALLAAIGAAFALPGGTARPEYPAVPEPNSEARTPDSIPGTGPAQVPAAAGPPTAGKARAPGWPPPPSPRPGRSHRPGSPPPAVVVIMTWVLA